MLLLFLYQITNRQEMHEPVLLPTDEPPTETNQDNHAGRAHTRISSRTIQSASVGVCLCVCVCARVAHTSERSFSIFVMHLALKRVVICKSSLP